MDPLFRQIERDLLRIETDMSVAELLELVTAVYSPIIAEYVAKQVVQSVRLVTPKRALSFLKFVYLYSKKDVKFFNLVKPSIPAIVMSCYKVSQVPETIEMYIQSWRMSNHWADTVEKCLVSIRMSSNRDELLHSIGDLKQASLAAVITRLRRSPKDVVLMKQSIPMFEQRLEAIIRTMNSVSRVVQAS